MSAAGARAAGLRARAAGLLERLPPRLAWVAWRTATVATAARRRGARQPRVDLAVIAWGVDGFEVERLVERLAGEQPPERLLLISDSDAVHVAAARGCRYEHVPPRADWEARRAGDGYGELASRRVLAILDDYRPERVAVVGDPPPELAEALPAAEALEGVAGWRG